MTEETSIRLAHLETEQALLQRRRDTLTLLATSPYSPYRDAAQEKLRLLREQIDAVQIEITGINEEHQRA